MAWSDTESAYFAGSALPIYSHAGSDSEDTQSGLLEPDGSDWHNPYGLARRTFFATRIYLLAKLGSN